ncbi:MAG: succinate dehydrogenase [Candidatus Methylomirabilia bacterium]
MRGRDLPGQFATAATLRSDAWWLAPLLTVLALGAFVVYTTWAALQGAHYEYKSYLSPFYSPTFKPSWWPFSPAILILWAPGGFRLTCYYYRKAYYRSFWGAPPACAVRDARARYTGETGFPLILQNVHRYFFYAAAVVLIFLWYDAAVAFVFDGRFGVGLGSLILLANVVLLTGYSLSCHSCRHLCGGNLDRFSSSPARYRAWKVVSALNERHMLWAWTSLFSVALADVYVRLLSMGVLNDTRFF